MWRQLVPLNGGQLLAPRCPFIWHASGMSSTIVVCVCAGVLYVCVCCVCVSRLSFDLITFHFIIHFCLRIHSSHSHSHCQPHFAHSPFPHLIPGCHHYVGVLLYCTIRIAPVAILRLHSSSTSLLSLFAVHFAMPTAFSEFSFFFSFPVFYCFVLLDGHLCAFSMQHAPKSSITPPNVLYSAMFLTQSHNHNQSFRAFRFMFISCFGSRTWRSIKR